METVTDSDSYPTASIKLDGKWVRLPHRWHGDCLRAEVVEPELYAPFVDGGGFDRPVPLWKELLDLDVRDRDQLADFYSRRGPLGILPHHVIEARYPPLSPDGMSIVAGGGLWVAPRGRYLLAPDGRDGSMMIEHTWAFVHVSATPNELRRVTQNGERLGVVQWLNAPGGFASSFWNERSLESVFEPYFPSCDGEERLYPALNAGWRFWWEYSEPYYEIDRALTAFRRWVDLRASFSDYYLSRTHLAPQREGDGIRVEWNFPSLLSIAAISFLLDAKNNDLRYCANPRCGMAFRLKRADQEFCTARCGSAFRGRKKRVKDRKSAL